MNDPTAAHAALHAFLRGVERRGVVFAQWQGGSVEAGDAALAATLRGFQSVAGDVAFAHWPRRFWAMLLASPALRGARGTAGEGGVPPLLAGLGGGPRAALLLRLVAGLAEADAAAVLGIARPTYRLALQRALPHRDDGSADPEAWRELSALAQQAVRAVPVERLARIGMLRDGVRPNVRPTASPAEVADGRRGWVWPATWTVLVLTTAALAATWWWPGWHALPGADAGRIVTEALPPAAQPAARFDPATSLQHHRDLALLLDQARGEAEAFEEPAFDAWLVQALADGEWQAHPASSPGSDAGSREPAVAGDPARQLASFTPDQREALQRRVDEWNALPEAMRRERREAWQAWQALPVDERARVRAAREAYRALPITDQQTLRERFDALDAGIRRGWLLGPVLGADWPRLHALVAQVPAEEREPLLQALRELPPQGREDLGVLAQRTPPQARDALRKALLSQAPGQRAQWLRRQVAP